MIIFYRNIKYINHCKCANVTVLSQVDVNIAIKKQ